MFNLDQAISEWRQQMAAGGIKAPEVLDELESHLRDDVDEQVRSGVGQRPAFDAAVQRIGGHQALNKEFCKVNRHGAWGLRGNPLALSFLAVWLIVMGLKNLPLRFLLLNMVNGSGLGHHYWAGPILFSSLSIALGVGLLCHRNFWRVCTIAFLALHITGNVGYIAAHGLSGSVYAYAPHIAAPGVGVEYDLLGGLGLLAVPYPVFYAVLLFNSAMWFFGLFLLTRGCCESLCNHHRHSRIGPKLLGDVFVAGELGFGR